MQTEQSTQRLLRREDAAKYLNDVHGLPENKQSLAKKAVYGGGPAFRKFGRHPLYAPGDLDAYAREAVSPPVRSTAELDSSRRRRNPESASHG